MKRFKISGSRSKRRFSGTAFRTNKRNFHAAPMRGGYRL